MNQIAHPGKSIAITLDEAWTCHCGAEQTSPGAWVAAHWQEELTHTCKACKTKRTVKISQFTIVWRDDVLTHKSVETLSRKYNLKPPCST